MTRAGLVLEVGGRWRKKKSVFYSKMLLALQLLEVKKKEQMNASFTVKYSTFDIILFK